MVFIKLTLVDGELDEGEVFVKVVDGRDAEGGIAVVEDNIFEDVGAVMLIDA